MHSIAHIRAQDMPAFCDAVLPALRVHTQLDAPEDLDQLLPPQPAFTFHIDEEDGAVVCFAQVAYDDTQMDLFEPARQGQPARDIVRETASQGLVRRYFPQGDTLSPDYAHPLPAYLGISEQRARTNASTRGRTYGSSYDSDPFYADGASPYSDGAPQHVFGQGERAFQQTDRFDKPARRTHRTPWFPSEDDAALYTLLTDGLQDLANIGDVFLSEQLKRVNVREAPKVQVSARVTGGLLDLQVESDGMSPAELVSYLASYKRKKRFLRLSNGDIVKLDGGVRAVSELAGVLDVSEQSLVDGTAEVSANRTLFVDALLKRAAGVRLERNESFRRIVRDFETVADADYPEPENLNGSLRPYQVEGFKWLSTLGHVGFGGILADEMGLGKTLQAIAYLLARKNEATEDSPAKPALIVCPASLVYNWTAEIQRFAPSLRVQPVVAAKRERAQAIRDAESQDVLVTSYDLMKRDIDAYEPQRFSCVILDEAQYIKNSATKAAKCAKRLSADVRFALTGTPIENRLSELWSIFDFLMPGVLGSREAFGRRFSKPIEDGDEQAAKRLQSLVGPFILRRLKADVLTDLPEKNESTVLASMEGEQLKLYRSNEQRLALTLSKQMPQEFATEKLKILAELTKLRQICCDPNLLYDNYKGDSAKLETCLELVRQAVDSGHSILLFSQFTSMLDIIEQRLDKEKIGHLKLTGQTSKEDRVKLVSRFQNHEAPVFLISLKAGGVGLNLTAADIVIHYDPWWNLAAQNQATDRAHRIGQTKDVSVFKLIAKNTIEERIVKMQESKRDLAESVIGGEASATASLTREDVLALLESESQE